MYQLPCWSVLCSINTHLSNLCHWLRLLPNHLPLLKNSLLLLPFSYSSLDQHRQKSRPNTAASHPKLNCALRSVLPTRLPLLQWSRLHQLHRTHSILLLRHCPVHLMHIQHSLQRQPPQLHRCTIWTNKSRLPQPPPRRPSPQRMEVILLRQPNGQPPAHRLPSQPSLLRRHRLRDLHRPHSSLQLTASSLYCLHCWNHVRQHCEGVYEQFWQYRNPVTDPRQDGSRHLRLIYLTKQN